MCVLLSGLNSISSYLLERSSIKEAPIPAYHGSPHSFKRFDTYYMGKGEGAQMCGWGLYFTESRDIAKDYYARGIAWRRHGIRTTNGYEITITYNQPLAFKKLTFDIGDYNGPEFNSKRFIETYNENGDVPPDIKQLVDRLDAESDHKKIKPLIIRLINSPNWEMDLADSSGEKEDLIEIINAEEIKPIAMATLYEVILWPNKNPNLLSWKDKITNKQWIQIEWMLSNCKESDFSVDYGLTRLHSLMRDVNFLYKKNQFSGSELCYELWSAVGQKDTSLFLLKAGIDGIIYPIELMSGGIGEKGWNYVVFDKSQVKIIKVEKFPDEYNS